MERRKRILIVIDWFLPGTNSGGPVRSYLNMIEHMANEADFFVVTRDSDYCSDKKYENIELEKWNKLTDNLNVYYINSYDLSISKVKGAIFSVDFDLVIINGLYSLYFSILPLFLLRYSKKKVVVSARGMLNPQAFSVKPIRKKLYLTISKFLGGFKNKIFHATNGDEASFIRGLIGAKTKIITAPNFPRKALDLSNMHLVKAENELKIVNIARISEEKGTLRMLSYLKEIKKGKITLDIYGPIYDEEYWDRCKQEIVMMPSSIKINYMGVAASDAIPDILTNYHLFVMLSEGENFGHSILEAMTCGLPVIISNLTPWTNLRERNIGWDLQLIDKKKFVSAIEYFLSLNSTEFRIWSNAARNYASDVINDSKTYNANATLLDVQ